MDRINIKCLIEGKEVELQFDKKAMPGETGPCYMITESGCFKGYVALQKNREFKYLGKSHYSDQDLQLISSKFNTQNSN